MAKAAKLTRAGAEEMAIAALGFIANDAEQLQRFVNLSGLDPGDLRRAAAEPGFLLGVLDYLVSDERLLLNFAADADIDPSGIERARHLLSD
jgi:hypothetical protein